MLATKSEKLTLLVPPQAASLVKKFSAVEGSFFPLATSNIDALRRFFDFAESAVTNRGYVLAMYNKGDMVVRAGTINSDTITVNPEFSYADVPLGLIVEGDVVVIKGGKATKKLEAGDFIGLFETVDWLSTHRKRNIGDWTLITNRKTKIMYFGASVLSGKGGALGQLQQYLFGIARTDQVPQPITTLPLLDWVASHTTNTRLTDYAIVAHTHILPNNFPFFRHLSYLVGFGRMFVLEKPYSTVHSTYNDLITSGCEVVQVRMEPNLPYEYAVQKSLEVLWGKVIEEQKKSGFKKLLIVDDGGDLWLSIPWPAMQGVSIAGVEQTQRGISRLANSSHRIPPIVNVAASGTKKLVESVFIGQSVVDKLQELGLLKSGQIGVMGMGSIGAAVVRSLEKLGLKPLHYDPSFHHNTPDDPDGRPSIDSLFNDAEVIIGTTGTDSLKGVALERIHGHKILASASSADMEFSSLLKMASAISTPFDTRHLRVHEHLSFDILNGGYPLNFDRRKDATPSDDIVLTRCLMYIGAMQSVQLIESGLQEGTIYPLDTVSQKKTLEHWIADKNVTENPSPISIKDIDQIVGSVAPQKHSYFSQLWTD